jgi:hypothetical protein
LVAVINGIGVARAVREGLIEADPQHDGEQSNAIDEDSSEGLFFPEDSTAPSSSSEARFASIFNLEASSFTPGATIQPSWPTSTGSFGKPSALAPFAPSTSTSSTPTGITQSGSLFPSFLPTSSTTTSGLGMDSTPVANPFQPKVQPPATSSISSTTATAPFQFPNFKFGQPTPTNPLPASTSSPFPFGKPSTVPPTFVEPSAQQQGKGQEQISHLGKLKFHFPPSLSPHQHTISILSAIAERLQLLHASVHNIFVASPTTLTRYGIWLCGLRSPWAVV